jgi:hypothetical protein
VQREVPGVAAFLDEVFGGLVPDADLDELIPVHRVVLTKVQAQAALTIVHVEHGESPFTRDWLQSPGQKGVSGVHGAKMAMVGGNPQPKNGWSCV